jgi:MFS family permease
MIGGVIMNNELRLFMVRHGGIVAFLGSLSGVAYTFIITGDIPGSIRAWHLAHLQGVMTGILLIAVSSYITHLNLDEKRRRLLAYSFIITGYCYSLGPMWGAILGVRGIEPVAPLSNLLMFISNSIASVSVLIGLGLTVYGAGRTKR